jgi:hypothetical protein
VLQRGVTSAGQTYEMSIGRTGGVVCVTVAYGRLADGTEQAGVVALQRSGNSF